MKVRKVLLNSIQLHATAVNLQFVSHVLSLNSTAVSESKLAS